MMTWKARGSYWEWVPGSLIAIRVVLGPLTFLLALTGAPPSWILVSLITAMLSDIFDGVIARRLKVATAPLRIADSYADAWFFAWVGLSAWLVHPDLLATYRLPILIEVGLQLAAYGFDLLRYGRVATLHAYSAKLWGFSLYAAAAGLLVWNVGWPIWIAFGAGLLSFLDASAIKFVLPGWRHDIRSVFEARRIRRAELERGAVLPG